MFRTAAPLSAALVVWLAMLLWGGLGSPIDERLYRALNGAEIPWLVDISFLLTQLGGWILLSTAAIAATAWLAFRRKRPIRAAVLIVTVTVGRLAVELQKAVFARVRPADEFHLVTVSSFSFPSGHAANATITWLALALMLPLGRNGKAAAVGCALTLALLVGLSRIVLGVHWPSDVVAGWAFGLFWVALCLRLSHVREPAPPAKS